MVDQKSTLVAFISALAAIFSAFYTYQISKETKNQAQIAKEQAQIAKDIASDNLLEQLGSGGPGDACLTYFDALKGDPKNFDDAILEKNHLIINKEIFDKLHKCLGRYDIQIDEPINYPYELKGVNAQKPAIAVLNHLNSLDRAFQRIEQESVDPCRILPTLQEYFIKWSSIEVLVRKIIEKKSPGSPVVWVALLDGSKELRYKPDTVFNKYKCK